MFGKRERFERTDVPQSSAASMTLALAALAFVVIGVLVSLRVATVLANRDESLGVSSLNRALTAQGDVETPEGLEASSDIFNNVLILTVDDADSDTPTLVSAELLTIDETAGSAVVASIALNTSVTNDAGTSMLQSMCAGSGVSSCIVSLSSAAGIKFSHVIVSSSDIWTKFDELRGMGARELVTSSPEAFASLRTDMTNDEFMNLVDRIGSIGSSNIARIDAPASESTLDDGTGVSILDSTQLRLALGLLVSAG